MELELISFSLCPYVQRSVIVLLEKKVEFKTTYIDLANKPEWFLKISPTGKVPLLRCDGHVLFESNVINEYLDETLNPHMHPENPLDRAKNRAWMAFSNELFSIQHTYFFGMTQTEYESSAKELLARFQKLEPNIKGPYFNGSSYSLVDASFAPFFMRFKTVQEYSESLFSETPNIKKWMTELLDRPSTNKSVVPDIHQQIQDYFRKKGSYLGKQL